MKIGDYLIQEKNITERDLSKALDEQRRMLPYYGILAKHLGILSNKEIFNILREQRINATKDSNFLDIALKRRLISQQEAAELTKYRNNYKELIGQILSRKGHITKTELVVALKKFSGLLD